WRRRHWLIGLAVALIVVPIVAAYFVTVPYYLISPGEARGVPIEIKDGTPVYPPTGHFLYTTVSLTSRVNVYDALRGWLDNNIEIVPEKDITGGKPKDQ